VSGPFHASPDGLVPAAAEARREAFFEVAMVTRHDLTTALHVALAALDACGRGDVVRAHRMLNSASDRIKSTINQLEDYGGKGHEAPRSCLATVHHVVVETLRARKTPGNVDVQLEVGVAEVDLAIPRSVLTLCLVAMVDAASLAGSATVRVHELANGFEEPGEGLLRIACEGRQPALASWQIEWAAKELERWGGRIGGPLQVRDGIVPIYAEFPRAAST
jgi:hypothetical protein